MKANQFDWKSMPRRKKVVSSRSNMFYPWSMKSLTLQHLGLKEMGLGKFFGSEMESDFSGFGGRRFGDSRTGWYTKWKETRDTGLISGKVNQDVRVKWIDVFMPMLPMELRRDLLTVGRWVRVRSPRRGALYVLEESPDTLQERAILRATYSHLDIQIHSWVGRSKKEATTEGAYLGLSEHNPMSGQVPIPKQVKVLLVGIWLTKNDEERTLLDLHELLFLGKARGKTVIPMDSWTEFHFVSFYMGSIDHLSRLNPSTRMGKLSGQRKPISQRPNRLKMLSREMDGVQHMRGKTRRTSLEEWTSSSFLSGWYTLGEMTEAVANLTNLRHLEENELTLGAHSLRRESPMIPRNIFPSDRNRSNGTRRAYEVLVAKGYRNALSNRYGLRTFYPRLGSLTWRDGQLRELIMSPKMEETVAMTSVGVKADKKLSPSKYSLEVILSECQQKMLTPGKKTWKVSTSLSSHDPNRYPWSNPTDVGKVNREKRSK